MTSLLIAYTIFQLGFRDNTSRNFNHKILNHLVVISRIHFLSLSYHRTGMSCDSSTDSPSLTGAAGIGPPPGRGPVLLKPLLLLFLFSIMRHEVCWSVLVFSSVKAECGRQLFFFFLLLLVLKLWLIASPLQIYCYSFLFLLFLSYRPIPGQLKDELIFILMQIGACKICIDNIWVCTPGFGMAGFKFPPSECHSS